MIQKKVKLINKLGLHARASMKLVDTANRFQSEIILKFNNREVNAKSIMNIMMLGATFGAEIGIKVSGDDEEQALKAIVDLINDRFGEKE